MAILLDELLITYSLPSSELYPIAMLLDVQFIPA